MYLQGKQVVTELFFLRYLDFVHLETQLMSAWLRGAQTSIANRRVWRERVFRDHVELLAQDEDWLIG